MKYILLVLFVLLLLIPTSAVTAQDGDSPDGWPIVERCIDGPTRRPDGWTYEGTILLTGYAGIHAVNDAWPTPRVVAFLGNQVPLGSAGLSPDAKWYAFLRGEFDREGQPSPSRTWHIEEIRVHNTSGDQMLRLPRDYGYTYGMSSKSWVQMRWWDNEHLLFEETRSLNYAIGLTPTIINIFTNETTVWEGQLNPIINQFDFYPSPDWSRAAVNTDDVPIDPDIWGLYDPISGELLNLLDLAEYPEISWMADSSHFAAEIQPDEAPTRQLVLFDRDGNFIDTVFDVTDLTETAWSKDNRYLALIERDYLYIADIEERRIVDTCFSTDSALAWSPYSPQLALMAEGNDHRPIYVWDMEQNQIYTVAYHDGAVIGWREQ